MATFYTVTAGNQTLAVDINQYANYLDGTTAGGALNINMGAAASVAYQASFSSYSGTVINPFFDVSLAADTGTRLQMYLSTTGMPFILWGDGTNTLGNLYGLSGGGLKSDFALTVAGQLNAAGGASLSSATISGGTNASTITASGAVTFNNNLTVTGTTSLGANSTAASEPLLTAASQATIIHVFTGTATPTGAVAGDVWIKG